MPTVQEGIKVRLSPQERDRLIVVLFYSLKSKTEEVDLTIYSQLTPHDVRFLKSCNMES